MQRRELNPDCLISASALQERYSTLRDHKLCVVAPILVKKKALNTNGNLWGAKLPEFGFACKKYFPVRQVLMLASMPKAYVSFVSAENTTILFD